MARILVRHMEESYLLGVKHALLKYSNTPHNASVSISRCIASYDVDGRSLGGDVKSIECAYDVV